MNLYLIGFFGGLEYGMADQPDIRDLRRDREQADERRMIEYLRSGRQVVFTLGLSRDVFVSDDEKIIGPLRLLTDGNWVWPSDLEYYLENYHIELSLSFVNHVRQNHWMVPIDIDEEAVCKALLEV